MPDTLPHMLRALSLEIEAIKQQLGDRQIKLHDGQLVGISENRWLYSFTVATDLVLRDDTFIRLIFDNQETDGIIVSFREGVLTVAVDADCGTSIESCRIAIDDSFLMDKLRERLEKVHSHEVDFNLSSAERIVGSQEAKTGEGDADPRCLGGPDLLNDAQRQAIRRALGCDTLFIWGPPGTGKTTTLARIVEAHFRKGHSVLLVSNTNIAVDTALEKVAERVEGEPEFHKGAVLRKGPIVKPELLQRFGSQVVLDDVVARLGEQLRQEKDAVKEELAGLEREERSLEEAIQNYSRLEEVARLIAASERNIAAVHDACRQREMDVKKWTSAAESLESDLLRAQGMSRLRRTLSGLNPEHLERKVLAAKSEARVSNDARRALANKLDQRRDRLKVLRRESQQLERSTSDYQSVSVCRKNLTPVQEKLRQSRGRLAEIDWELNALRLKVLASCRVLATTVYQTYLGSQNTRCFDVVVIDEASMLILPLAYYAAGLAQKAVIVSGDFRQLPPIVRSENAQVSRWLKRDVFRKVRIPERLRDGAPIPELVSLRTQYRMAKPICDAVNKLFYQDWPLSTHVPADRPADAFPLGTSALLYVDTSPFKPWSAYETGKFTRYNLFHALLIQNLAIRLSRSGYIPGPGAVNNVIGAIAPYHAQSKLTRALFVERLGKNASGFASTVHSFQGNEKELILLDLTDSPGTKLGRFMRAINMDEDGARLLNVALSRARRHVLLIANFRYLRGKAQEGSFVRRLLGCFENGGVALRADEFLPIGDIGSHGGDPDEKTSVFELPDHAARVFTETTFYPAFKNDLACVQSSVVVFSPFATVRGTDRWMQLLRNAIDRRVSVRVLVGARSEANGAQAHGQLEAVRTLRENNIPVDLRAGMHEKIAVLDEHILWHGSLNILSHYRTHESMLRIDSPEACSTVLRLVSARSGVVHDDANWHFPGNPQCQRCNGPTIRRIEGGHISYVCEDADCGCTTETGRRRTRTGTRAERIRPNQNPHESNTIPCPRPGCDGVLTERTGQYGPFMGCSRYPDCGHWEPIDR